MTTSSGAPGSPVPTPSEDSPDLDVGAVRAALSEVMPALVADLERLVAIPSCAFPGFPPEPVLSACPTLSTGMATATTT